MRSEPALQRALNKYSPHFDLRRRPSVVPEAEPLANELATFIISHEPGMCVRTAIESTYPLLHSLDATVWCSGRPYHAGGNFVRWHLPGFDVATLTKCVDERIADKRGKRYTLRPLWLFISISDSWSTNSGTEAPYREFLDLVDAGHLSFDTTGFDKVMVGVRGRSVVL